MPRKLAILAILLCLSSSASASKVEIVVSGSVEFNQIRASDSSLGLAVEGDPVEIRFYVDSESFTDSASIPTRGYPIQPDTFRFTAGAYSAGLRAVEPSAAAPLWGIRNDDPAVDGFFLSDDVSFPLGVATDQDGRFGPFRTAFSVTYGPLALPSLDVLDAVGNYDLTGLQVFDFAIMDGSNYALGAVFERLTIGPAVQTLPGDFNDDGSVDIADYVVWRNLLGAAESALPSGSTTDDSEVIDLGEYTIWKSNFAAPGSSIASAADAAVPEPSSVVTSLMLVLGGFAIRNYLRTLQPTLQQPQQAAVSTS
ncbi:hypothetical protein NG895_23590 [Aeoliella sp. ICT_H6.2]|uniref:Dockerin domain-containing protein n=1 Tax=Aeoliella straminimaris TaxID=2954799 RepID=A0A9X2FHH3_9BACT|nr:hypothetical protein [Aeoliella straminimaris]MCO6046894.1 hypothetical protein [Aeoliella straminimaris]